MGSLFPATRRGVLRGGSAAGLVGLGPFGQAFAQAPKRMGDLKVGAISDINVPDPHALGAAQFPLIENVFDTLIRYTDSLTPQPGLATAWAWNADKTQFTMDLRPGVKFHSGAEFTAADVLFTFKRILDPALGTGQLATMATWIKDAAAPSPRQVVVKFDRPRPNFIDLLTQTYVADKSVLEHGDVARNVSGTGAYRFAQWRPGQGYALARNPVYFETHAGPERITVTAITDPEALSAQLMAGAIDIAQGLNERGLRNFQRDPQYVIVRNDFGPEYYYLGMNTTKAPFTDKRVRQAFAYAVNRKRFVTSTLGGFGEATAAPWPPQSSAYDPRTRDRYPFDLAKAKALLVEAGIDRLDVAMMTSNAWPPLAEQAQQFQADLKTIGVDLSINTVDAGRWVEEIGRRHSQAIWTGGMGYSQYSPETVFAMAAPLRASNNMPQFDDPAYGAMITLALTEPDDAARLAEVRKLTDYIEDQAFTSPISRHVQALVCAKGVKDPRFMLSGYVSFKDVLAS